MSIEVQGQQKKKKKKKKKPRACVDPHLQQLLLLLGDAACAPLKPGDTRRSAVGVVGEDQLLLNKRQNGPGPGLPIRLSPRDDVLRSKQRLQPTMSKRRAGCERQLNKRAASKGRTNPDASEVMGGWLPRLWPPPYQKRLVRPVEYLYRVEVGE